MRASLGAVVLLIVAAVDIALALTGRLAGFDRAVLLALSGGPAWLWLAITHCADPPVRLALAACGAVGLWLGGRGRAEPVILMGTVGLALLTSTLLKDAIARPRPALLPHLDVVTSWSMPSGHALNGMVVWLMLALLLPPARWRPCAVAGAVLLVFAIGASRVALAVHWPSDVIAGWAIGGAIARICGGAALARRRAVLQPPIRATDAPR